jgi:hypothetical protein
LIVECRLSADRGFWQSASIGGLSINPQSIRNPHSSIRIWIPHSAFRNPQFQHRFRRCT